MTISVKFLRTGQRMANIPNGAETLPRISTDGRAYRRDTRKWSDDYWTRTR